MRNGKKDEIRMTAIREDMMAEGFRLFAERGIESVNMKDLADACHVGIATLYRYFRVTWSIPSTRRHGAWCGAS